MSPEWNGSADPAISFVWRTMARSPPHPPPGSSLTIRLKELLNRIDPIAKKIGRRQHQLNVFDILCQIGKHVSLMLLNYFWRKSENF